jgi:hypothetical protein
MNTFKRKALFTAVVAVLGAAAGTAEAVYLSPNNTGQVLVYPYYTVQSTNGNSWNTYISVVNTTSRAKAVKVRVLEGKASAEVLDFNLFLSPNDVWTAAIVPAGTDSGSPGHLITTDVSCTNPPIPAGGVDFRNFTYASASDRILGTGLDRTREGYVEMLEMGTLTGAWATAVTHVNGTPANCAVVQGQTLTPSSIEAPQGGLVGTGTLINVNSGRDAGYKADALDAFSITPIYSDAGSAAPTLADANPARSLVINSGGVDPVTGSSALATVYRTDWTAVSGVTAGARATAAVFMHSSVLNEYILDTATASNTDWVITQPLKRNFVTTTTAATPYTNVLTTSGACETVNFTYFDREERSATASGVDFSPLPPSAAPNSLCWESNVLSIRNGNSASSSAEPNSLVLGSVNVTNVNVTSAFQNGWARLTFAGTGAATDGMAGAAASSDRTAVNSTTAAIAAGTAGAQTFFGLPSTGFMIRTFDNGTLTCTGGSCQGNYGALFRHSYVTTITP